jgi:hypothetical protein
MQNYLNQSFKKSEHAVQSLNGEEENEPEDPPERPAKTSLHQIHNTSALSLQPMDPRKNDSKYACLRVRQAEFFCTKDSLIKHSNYMMRVFEKHEYLSDARERNA